MDRVQWVPSVHEMLFEENLEDLSELILSWMAGLERDERSDDLSLQSNKELILG